MSRPNKYIENVLPRINEIPDMALTMTEKQIARALGVGYSSFFAYKKKYPELNKALRSGREHLVQELKSVLIQKARGFRYEERSIIKENGEEVREEIKIKQALPDVAALNLLLKNYDRDNWSNDPQMQRIREKELELRERQIALNEW